MEKIVGIIGDENNTLTKALMQGWGQCKYKIYRSFGRKDSQLVFQTNNKEFFISEWAKEYRSVSSVDGVGVSFTIGDFDVIGGGFMNSIELRKYLDELEQK
jgi:hypothetical protein